MQTITLIIVPNSGQVNLKVTRNIRLEVALPAGRSSAERSWEKSKR